MEVVFQGGDGDDTLLARLVDAADGAARGGAIFAWASRGAEALLADEAFVALATAGTFDLVVGTDSITDTAALRILRRAEAALSGLTVRAFVNDDPRSLFHPKLAWFDRPEGLRVLVGSGNLTKGGLIGNWEAFTVATLTGADADRFRASIAALRARLGDRLRPLDDPDVIRQGERNTGREIDLRVIQRRAPRRTVVPAAEDAVYIRLAANNRAPQASLPRDGITGFFGIPAVAGSPVDLVRVDADGRLGPRYTQRLVYKAASDNYCLELEGETWLPQPPDDTQRAILLFLACGGGLFAFHVPPAGSAPHAALLAHLAEHHDPDRGKWRHTTTVEVLRRVWPDCPLVDLDVSELA